MTSFCATCFSASRPNFFIKFKDLSFFYEVAFANLYGEQATRFDAFKTAIRLIPNILATSGVEKYFSLIYAQIV